eukprot:Nk52_evm1s2001 gene=Nk52_evmTU1s2001
MDMSAQHQGENKTKVTTAVAPSPSSPSSSVVHDHSGSSMSDAISGGTSGGQLLLPQTQQLLHTKTVPDFYKHFLSGAIGLSTSFAIMHPLDTLKTKIQSATTTTASSSSPLRRLVSTASGSGTVFRDFITLFSKGFGSSVIGAAPQGGMRLGTYEFTKRSIHGHVPLAATSALAAVAGDIASSLVKIPREVVTQRLQTDMYTSTSHAVRNIFREEGIRGFYTGSVSTAIRDMPFMVILFVTYDQLKAYSVEGARFTAAGHSLESIYQIKLKGGEAMAYGGLAGALAGWLTAPFDMIKTRIMTHTCVETRPTFVSAARQLYGENGYRSFFVGAVPRSCWWFCVCSIFFQTYEGMKEFLGV